jgi:acetyl-CoA acyltransferase
VKGLLDKTKLDPNLIDDVIMGNVVVKSAAPNLARELVIDLGLPARIPGVMCSRACLSGLQAIEQAVSLIESGHAEIVVAGGSDSLSNGELPMPRDLTLALGKYTMGGGNKKGWEGYKELFNVSLLCEICFLFY